MEQSRHSFAELCTSNSEPKSRGPFEKIIDFTGTAVHGYHAQMRDVGKVAGGIMSGKYSADWWAKFALGRLAAGGPDGSRKIELERTRVEAIRGEPANCESNGQQTLASRVKVSDAARRP